jgi:peptidoglycan-associated lipoprotein
MNKLRRAKVCCLALPLVVAACAVSPPVSPPKSDALPPPDADGQYRVVFPDEGHGKVRHIRATLGDDLAETCGLVRAHFDFDSADPLPEDRLYLRDVAECLNRPALRDKLIAVVGRADSRGDRAYNLALGRRRAEAVKQVLVDAGVPDRRALVASDGNRGAVGGDGKPYSFGYDRRVDVMLVGMVHAPR